MKSNTIKKKLKQINANPQNIDWHICLIYLRTNGFLWFVVSKGLLSDSLKFWTENKQFQMNPNIKEAYKLNCWIFSVNFFLLFVCCKVLGKTKKETLKRNIASHIPVGGISAIVMAVGRWHRSKRARTAPLFFCNDVFCIK